MRGEGAAMWNTFRDSSRTCRNVALAASCKEEAITLLQQAGMRTSKLNFYLELFSFDILNSSVKARKLIDLANVTHSRLEPVCLSSDKT